MYKLEMALRHLIRCFIAVVALHTTQAQIPPCTPLGRNLILNPSFEQGYFGFTSDFGRGLNNATHCNCATQGWILVAQINPHVNPGCQGYPPDLSDKYGGPNTVTDANPNHLSNTAVATVNICNAPLPDHTTGSGFFLTVDPDACEGRSYWKQPLQVCPNTNYYFSVWVRNIGGLPAPTFHFEAGGQPVTSSNAYPLGEWVQTSAFWNSGTLDGPISLELVNDLPGCDANDVAIDDLFFGVCGAVDLSCEDLFRYCPEDPSASFRLSGHAVGLVQPEYRWQHQSSSGSPWVDLAGQKDTLLIINAPNAADAGWYRLIAAEHGNVETLSCAVISAPIQLAAYTEYNIVDTVKICVGESYAGYSNPGIYPQHYQTVMGCDSIRTLDLRVRGEVHIFVPNAFSPNDDGINDRMQPFLSDVNVDNYLWRVFDRWGNLVFETRNPLEAWDGSFRGKPCAAGVYAYCLKTVIRDCQEASLFGDLTLIR